MKSRAAMAWRCAIFASLVLLASCSSSEHGFLAAAGPVAQAERDHFFSIIGWTLIVIVPLFVATPIVLWKYRLGKKGATYRPNWTFSWILEGLIWGLPLVIVAILGWNLWDVSHRLDPYDPIPSDKPALPIQVVSLDWKWLFIYPEQGVAAANELVLPVDRPISFRLTSATVMQSFFIPRLGSQIYTMPGMVTQLNLLAATPGQYRGMNTQYNGEGFAEQKFKVHAVDEAHFKRWIAQQHARPPLDMKAYKELAERSVLPEPKSFGRVSTKLFKQIVARTKATPASETGGAMPKSEQEQEEETKRVDKQRRAYQQKREQGAWGLLPFHTAPRCDPKWCQTRRRALAAVILRSSPATPYGAIFGPQPEGTTAIFPQSGVAARLCSSATRHSLRLVLQKNSRRRGGV